MQFERVFILLIFEGNSSKGNTLKNAFLDSNFYSKENMYPFLDKTYVPENPGNSYEYFFHN